MPTVVRSSERRFSLPAHFSPTVCKMDIFASSCEVITFNNVPVDGGSSNDAGLLTVAGRWRKPSPCHDAEKTMMTYRTSTRENYIRCQGIRIGIIGFYMSAYTSERIVECTLSSGSV